MSAILGTSVTGAGGSSAYAVNNSLRFRRSSPSYLSRTFSAGNLRLWTWSAWVKRGVLASDTSTIFDTNSSVGGEPRGGIKFRDDCLYFNQNPSGSSQTTELKSTAVFRDPSAWYHVVVAWDTAQATAANRVKMYINGVQITSFQIATYPGQNTDSALNSARTHKLGADGPNITGECFDGYLAEVNFIGGLALTPSSFGETNASTGVWQPKAYTGSYSGTNSFYQKYSSIATTSGSNTGLGQDFSGNGNYFNTNNISVTSGVTYDAMTDSPTPVSDTVGNYCVLSPLAGDVAPTNGNLYVTGVDKSTLGTVGASSGKWYFEMTCVSNVSTSNNDGVGVANCAINNAAPDKAYYIYRSGGVKLQSGGSNTAYGATFTTGDVIGVAYDADAGSLVFYKNNVSQGTAFTGITGTMLPVVYSRGISTTPTLALNFGQQPFVYTPPAGFKRYQTYNLPTPTIGASSTTLANKYFDVNTYTGTNTTNVITNSGGMQPDFVWIKNRNNDQVHALVDSVRGVTKQLVSNSSGVEGTNTAGTGIQSLNSNGFTLGLESSAQGGTNASGYTYVAWQWRASNATGVTNTAGSITSTVSANTTSGFSVVTYTGNGTAGATVGHGLGVAPKMLIIKARDGAGYSWKVYVGALGSGSHLELESTAAAQGGIWNSTNPSSTVFTLGTNAGVNENGKNYVCYAFSEVAGYSKFGSYTGNGSTDGTFVYLGFRPAYVLIKRTNTTGSWVVWDAARTPYNPTGTVLYPNYDQAEDVGSSYYLDFVSNGFKIRGTDVYDNASGSTYIYMAFAETPFNYSLAR